MLTDKEQEEIRRKLLGLEEEPPAGAWSKIAVDIQPQQQPRSPWWHAAAALLLLLLSSTGVYYFVTQQSDNGTAIVNVEQKQRQEETLGANASEKERGLSVEKRETAPVEKTPLTAEASGKVRSEAPEQARTKVEQPTTEPRRAARERTRVIAKREASVPVSQGIATLVDKDEPTDGYSRPNLAKSDTAPTAGSSADLLSGRIPTLVNSEAFTLPASPVSAKMPQPTYTLEQPTSADDAETNQAGEWYVCFIAAPRYAFRSFTPSVGDEVYITKLHNMDRLDPERMGYELGMSAGKSLLPQLYLETNLSMMQLRENVSYSYTTGKVDTIVKSLSSDGTIRATPLFVLGERQLKSSYTYGNLRVGATFFFMEHAQRRFNITVAGGMSLLVKGRTEEHMDGELLGAVDFPDDDNPLEQTNYNLMLGIGYNMALHRQYELMVMPTINYFLGSTYSNREPFGMRPYSLGVSFQVRRRFGR